MDVRPTKAPTERELTQVRMIAARIRAEFELRQELGDLESAGVVGLLEAKQRFDASHGVAFSTFAHYRIRGAVLDYVRKSGPVSRRAYEKMRLAESTDAVCEGSAAPPAQGAPSVGEAVGRLDATLHRLTAAFVLECVGQAPESEPAAADALSALVERETRGRVRGAVERLDPRARALIEGHYFAGRRFDEVAAELGISKSWASRIHTKALDELRRALKD